MNPAFVQQFVFRNFDPDQLREVINGADLQQTIIEAKDCSATVQQFRYDQVSIDSGHYSFPVFARGHFAEGCICIGVSRGQIEPTWINGYHLSDSSLQVYAEGAEMTYRAGPSTDWVAITVPRSEIQQVALHCVGRELDLPERGMRNYEVPSHYIDELMARIAIRGNPGDVRARIKVDSILKSSAEALASAEPGSHQVIEERRRYRARAIRQADDLIRFLVEHGEAYCSRRICRELGVSERNLQLLFRGAVGVSPKAWFRRVSLDRVRSALLSSAPRRGIVSEVALACGFEHFGRFSLAYRKQFGESPSETVRRQG